MGDRHLAVPAAHARCQRCGEARRGVTGPAATAAGSFVSGPATAAAEPAATAAATAVVVGSCGGGAAAAVVTGAGVAVRPGADLSAGAGAGCRASCAAATGARGRASGATCRPSARAGITSEGCAATATGDENHVGAEEDRGPATACACAQGRGGVGWPSVTAPAEPEAAPCTRHARTVSAGSLALAADNDRVDRSGCHGDRRLCPAPESWRCAALDPARGALDDECGVADAGRDGPGLVTAGGGKGVSHPGCMGHADEG